MKIHTFKVTLAKYIGGQKPLIAFGCVCILGSFLFIQQLPVIAKWIRLGASSEMSNSTN